MNLNDPDIIHFEPIQASQGVNPFMAFCVQEYRKKIYAHLRYYTANPKNKKDPLAPSRWGIQVYPKHLASLSQNLRLLIDQPPQVINPDEIIRDYQTIYESPVNQLRAWREISTKEHDRVHLRVFVRNLDPEKTGPDDFFPTKRALMFAADYLPEICDVIDKFLIDNPPETLVIEKNVKPNQRRPHV